MTLQASGAISLADIAGEFGGDTPHSMSEYYRNGAYVTSNNAGIPEAGAIDFADFYGAQKVIYSFDARVDGLLDWQTAVANLTSTSVSLYADPAIGNVVLSTQPGTGSNTHYMAHTIPSLPAGTYYWRMTGKFYINSSNKTYIRYGTAFTGAGAVSTVTSPNNGIVETLGTFDTGVVQASTASAATKLGISYYSIGSGAQVGVQTLTVNSTPF